MDSILKNKYRYYHINPEGEKVYKYGWGKNDAPPEKPPEPGEKQKIREIDCSHLVNRLLKDYGYEIPFQNTDWLHRSKYYDIINPKDVKPGDLILWKEHVGVVESYDPGSISGTFFGSQRSTGPATAKFADRSKFKPKNPGDRPPYWQAPDLFLRPKPQYHRDNIPQKAQADSGEGSFDDDDDDGIPGTPGPTKTDFDGDGPSNYKSNIILTLFLNLFQNLYSSSGPESSNPGGSGPSPGGSGPGSRGPGSGPGSSGPGSSGPGSGPGGSGPGGSGPRPGSSGPKSGPGSERSRPGSERSNSQRSNQDRDWFRNTNDEFRQAREEAFRRTHEESRRQEQNERSRSSSTPRYFASRPSDARKSTPGSWVRPLRASVRYAASHVSPLVLDLNGDGIKLLPYTQGVFFDIDGDGFAERVDWITPEEGQLARD